MIKKIFHYVCAIVAGLLWSIVLGGVFVVFFMFVYRINLLNPNTYIKISEYWNSGRTISMADALKFLSLFFYFPICIYGWIKLAHYKYMRLITVPLNKIANAGLDDYKAPDVNIKNLKIEEKKTLEQIVQERLEQEKKKQGQSAASSDFRKIIIDKIEENKK